MEPETPHRLPRTVEPRRYELTLTPDLAAATFAGEERVEVVVHEATDRIVLNALELDILTAELVAEDGHAVIAGTVALDTDAERATVALDATAEPGTWSLHLTFTGVLNDKLHGWYRSTFTDDEGRTHVIATTQMEPTDARRAFPCWDEPDRKAVFEVTLIVDDGMLAVSNGPVVEEADLGNGKRQVRFGETMPMSTYLVAFVVGPLAAGAPVDVDGTPVRVVCRPGSEHLTSFALDVAAHSLGYFTTYFGIAYPGEKLDLVALPDFAMGAMENLGAVTFRESLLLIDPAVASRVELERIADVIAHEVAHMWFGDLVTMRWWNGIWLNEAFATFMELLCVDAYRPEWERWVTFGLTRGAAMGIDSLASTRPIEFPVVLPSEAEEMFDPLTYQKGAGVLRMLEQYLGGDVFQRGIASYIDRHRYGNTETTDLWDAIEEASGEPARTTMDSWIFQGGHPVVAVSAAHDARSLRLRQERFRYLADHDEPARWRIPILLRTSAGSRRLLLSDDEEVVTFDTPVDWVVVNEGGWGVYRVQYEGALFAALVERLAELDALERFTLANDTWALVLAGRVPLDDFVGLARRLAVDEDDPNVWSVLLGGLDLVERSRADTPDRAAEVRSLIGELCRPVLARIGWAAEPGEPETRRTLRATVVRALGVLAEDHAVRTRAAELFDKLGSDVTAVDPDVAGAVVTVAAHGGGEAAYTEFLRRWREAPTPQEELRYLYGLGGFEHLALVQRTLDLTLDEVRSQNAPFLVSLLLQNRVGGAAAWQYVEDHWHDLLRRFPEPLLDRMLEGIVVHNTPDAAARIRAFLEANPLPGRAKQIAQLLERLDVNVAFRERLTR